jgi:caspase domain-containing protein
VLKALPKILVGLWLASCLLAQTATAEQPRKSALLVGVSEYQDKDVPVLLAPEKSIQRVKSLLEDKFEFDQIELLLGPDAKRESIIKALETMAAKKYGPEDVVVFYFSGHGSFVLDDDGDEIDGFDETICPYDTLPLTADTNQHDNLNQIRDDELNALFTKISQQTKNLTVVLDCCHSGTGTRNVEIRQALTIDYDPEVLAKLDTTKFIRSSSRSALGNDGRNQPGRWTAISACQSNQRAYQYDDDVTILTKVLTEELELATAQTEYSALMERVVHRVKSEGLYGVQSPTLEESERHFVLGGTASDQPLYYLAHPESGSVILEAGRAHGITPASVFQVYPPGNRWKDGVAQSAPIGKYKAVKVHALKTILEPLDNAPQTIDIACRAIETSHGFDEFVDSVWLDTGLESLKSVVEKQSHLRLAPSPEQARWRIGIGEKNKVGVFTVAGNPFDDIQAVAIDQSAQLLQSLNDVVRFRQILELENRDASSMRKKYRVQVFAGENKDGQVEAVGEPIEPNADGFYVINPQDHVLLRIKGRSSKPTFFGVLFMNPTPTTVGSEERSYVIASLLEEKLSLKSTDRAINVGAKKVVRGDSGDEVILKLLAATDDTDFGVLTQDGYKRDAVSSNLEQLLATARKGKGTRDAKSMNVDDWDARTFRIKWR